MKDEALENNIVTLFERAWSVRRLSREFGISRGRVNRILEHNEYKRETGRQHKSLKWSGYYYVVPKQYLLEACPVRVNDTEIIIYSPECEQIKRYPLAEKGQKNRYVGRTHQQPSGKIHLDANEITQRLKALSPVMDEYINQVIRHKPKNSYLYHLHLVLSLKVNYHVDDIVIAVRRALKHKVYEGGAIRNFLSLNAEKKNEVKLLPKTRDKYEQY